MANVSSATSFFPKAEENSVAMTLSGSILAGAATVGINGMTNYTDGDVVVFTVDPATASLKQVFTGTKSGANIINCVWTEMPTGGSNVAHAAGATVIDYVSATHWDLFQKGVTASLNQDGSMKSSAVQTALNISSGATGGWNPLGFAPTSVTYNGNHNYSLVFNAHDLTPQLTPGMRLQTTRTVAAPTQCTSLNGTTQFYSKSSPAGMTFTNFPVASAWIKLSSYGAGAMSIISRYNGTSGWDFQLSAQTGQVAFYAFNAASTNFTGVLSYQSVPLNKWVHVSAQLDMSTGTLDSTHSWIMIDGVSVLAQKLQGGTNPTALIQAGNLEVGSRNAGTQPFPGKLAQVAIYSAAVTQANIVATISQGLAGTETSLISAYSFNGVLADLNANANILTANGSALATNADSPFGGQADGTISSTLDYAEILSDTFSTNTTLTIRSPEGNTIPTSGGVSTISYSTQANPYGYPGISNTLGEVIIQAQTTTGIGAVTDLNGYTVTVIVPQQGAPLKISSFVGMGNTVAGLVNLSIKEGSTILAQLQQSTPNTTNAFGYYVETPVFWATAGSHTYKLTLSTSSGSGGSQYADTSLVSNLKVEKQRF